MELFSEVYGCYFTVVARILERAAQGISRQAAQEIADSYGFYDSAFHLLPSLFSGEWSLLTQKDGWFYTKLSHADVKRPMTTLEKS